jgi:endonuclease/exonuclease/phosphatase family metal-dependent hydrolase
MWRARPARCPPAAPSPRHRNCGAHRGPSTATAAQHRALVAHPPATAMMAGARRVVTRAKDEPAATVAAGNPSLSGLLSFNVWFDQHEKERRAASLFALIEASRPAIVALQEVTPRFLTLLLKEDWAQQRYAFSTREPRSASDTGGVSPYGCMLLVDKTLQPTFRAIELPSEMGRALVLAHVVLPSGVEITAATVHLESLSSQPLRERQLRKIARALQGTPAVLCGDFNFDARRNWSADYACAEDGVGLPDLPGSPALDNDCLAAILPGWVDLWAAHHPTEHGFTFDSETCSNAERSAPRRGDTAYEQMRYDRVMVGPGLLSAAANGSIELAGAEPDASIGCHISDHFGLMADLDLDNAQMIAAPQAAPAAVPVPPPVPAAPVPVPTQQQQAGGGLGDIADGLARGRLRPTETVFTAKDGTKRTVVGLGTAGDAAPVIGVERGERPEYLQSESEKGLDATPSQRFDVDDPKAMEHLEQLGYVVIANATAAAEVVEQTDRLWTFLEGLSKRGGRSRISRDNPLSWEAGWPGSQSNGIISGHGFNHSDFMWAARTNPVVLKAFSRVWGVGEEDELISSFDGGNVFRPTNPAQGGCAEWATQGGWWHVDQSTLCAGHTGRCSIQGLVAYTDADETTGGLCVVPGSHLQHEELCARAADPAAGDFVTVPASDPVLATPGRLVTARAGDLILWDSRTVHCNTPATRAPAASVPLDSSPAAQLKRIASYVCLVPRSFATEATIARRQDAYRSNTGSTHWPQHLALGPSGDAFGLPSQVLEDAPSVVRSLVGEFAQLDPEPSAEAMAAMAEANAAEAAGDLGEAQRWIKEAERLGHTLLAKHGGWR